MKETVFEAKKRDVTGKQVKALRREGRLPAIIYGYNIEPIAVTLDLRDVSRVMPTITPSHLVKVNVEGVVQTTLVRERQRHPVSGALLHVDFLAVSMTEKLRANVLVELTGESPAVKDLNAVLVSGLEQLEVECLPADLPERIMVDVSGLIRYGDAIHVRDIRPPDRVEVLAGLDEIIALVTAPAAEELVTTAVEGAEEPDVVEKGKKEEEE